MEIGKWKLAQTWRHFKRPASSKGMWKQFVDDSKKSIQMAQGGPAQLVQPGPGRQGYQGKDIGVAGGKASASTREVLGLKPHEVTAYRRLVTERAAKRGIEAPNWDTHPGRGYSSDNLKGQSIAKDIKRRLVGSRKTDIKKIGVGSGTHVEGKILSKVDQDKIKKRFGSKYDGEWNFKTKKNPSGNTYGISNTGKGKKNYDIGQKVRNYILGQHGPNYAFDNFDGANYHLTQMYRAANNKTNPNKNYRPIYGTKGIVGYVDLTEKGGGKEYYHADYTGVDSNGKKALLINKNHPDAAEINKLIEIVEGTKQDRTVLDSLFKKHDYETPSFERLLDSLMETDGAKYIDSAIHKHHQYGVAREPGAIKLVTRDQNMFSKLIEKRVDTGKMTTKTAHELLKPMGIQIVRDGKKIGAPDIDPKKQIKDWKKWIERKSLTGQKDFLKLAPPKSTIKTVPAATTKGRIDEALKGNKFKGLRNLLKGEFAFAAADFVNNLTKGQSVEKAFQKAVEAASFDMKDLGADERALIKHATEQGASEEEVGALRNYLNYMRKYKNYERANKMLHYAKENLGEGTGSYEDIGTTWDDVTDAAQNLKLREKEMSDLQAIYEEGFEGTPDMQLGSNMLDKYMKTLAAEEWNKTAGTIIDRGARPKQGEGIIWGGVGSILRDVGAIATGKMPTNFWDWAVPAQIDPWSKDEKQIRIMERPAVGTDYPEYNMAMEDMRYDFDYALPENYAEGGIADLLKK